MFVAIGFLFTSSVTKKPALVHPNYYKETLKVSDA